MGLVGDRCGGLGEVWGKAGFQTTWVADGGVVRAKHGKVCELAWPPVFERDCPRWFRWADVAENQSLSWNFVAFAKGSAHLSYFGLLL